MSFVLGVAVGIAVLIAIAAFAILVMIKDM